MQIIHCLWIGIVFSSEWKNVRRDFSLLRPTVAYVNEWIIDIDNSVKNICKHLGPVSTMKIDIVKV
jgi:hypothetical protein